MVVLVLVLVLCLLLLLCCCWLGCCCCCGWLRVDVLPFGRRHREQTIMCLVPLLVAAPVVVVYMGRVG